MDKTLHVTKFKADSAHLSPVDANGNLSAVNKPKLEVALKATQEALKSSTASINPMNGICNKVESSLGKMNGLLGAVNNDINSNKKRADAEIAAVKNLGKSLTGGGMRKCPTPQVVPVNSVLNNAKSSILNSAKSLTSLRLKPDDLLLGENTRSLLVKEITSLCGLKLNDPFAGLMKGFSDLLKILDNASLFANSDLLGAIAKCAKLQSGHSKALTGKMNKLAKSGNAKAVKDIVTNIPDTSLSNNEASVLASTMADTKENAKDLISATKEVGIPTSDITSSSVSTTTPNEPNKSLKVLPTTEDSFINTDQLGTPNDPNTAKSSGTTGKPETSSYEKPITTQKILDAQKLSELQDKPITTAALLADNNIKADSKAITKMSEIVKPTKTIHSEKGSKTKNPEDKEIVKLQNNVKQLFKPLDKEVSDFTKRVTSNNKRDDIEMGLEITNIDFTNAQTKRPSVSISSTFPSRWDNVPTNQYPTSKIDSFVKVPEESKLKLNLNNFVLTEDRVNALVTVSNKKKDTRPNNIQKFGTSNKTKTPVIKRWETVTQSNGNQIRTAVYG